MKNIYSHQGPFQFELGGEIPSIDICYNTYGQLNAAKDNVVWVCHALTASGDVVEWWPSLVGEGKAIDTNKYFVVCANILGSCYGTTGPSSINPATNKKYGLSFPFYTIRDMVKAHQLLKAHLQIDSIHLLMGGSMGGYQALEFAIAQQETVKNLFLIGTSPEESAWGKAIHTTQRMAISSDPDWQKGEIGVGDSGLKVARGIGMLTYRNYEMFKYAQTDTDVHLIENHRAATYIQYQAQKLANRFDTVTYYKLLQALDTHQLARHREKTTEEMLQSIKARTMVMGIASDILCPLAEQEFMAAHIPHATLAIIESLYGHDGFLTEGEKIGQRLLPWLQQTV